MDRGALIAAGIALLMAVAVLVVRPARVPSAAVPPREPVLQTA